MFRTTKRNGLAPEKEPRCYKILNPIFIETNEKLNDTSFSVLNNELDIANSQNGDRPETEIDSNRDKSDPTNAATSGTRPAPKATVLITLPSRYAHERFDKCKDKMYETFN